jgi:hypothetical protein
MREEYLNISEKNGVWGLDYFHIVQDRSTGRFYENSNRQMGSIKDGILWPVM